MKLSEADITKRMRAVRSWQRNSSEITRTFEFDNFAGSMKFANAVAELAEKEDHHPDILVQYNTVTLTLSTHSEGGLTAKDFDLAEKIEKITSKK